jgi:hypothetical protein
MFFSEVTAFTKAQVFLGIKPFHFGEEILDFRNYRLVGTVIQDDNLRINALACVTHGLQARRNEIARVISNDND